jgi:hypothetical protein
MTRKRHYLSATLAGLGLAGLLAGILFFSGRTLGWINVISFTVVAVGLIPAPSLSRRLSDWAFSLYMFIVGLTFGVPLIWAARPVWVDTAFSAAFVLAVAAYLVQSWRERRSNP